MSDYQTEDGQPKYGVRLNPEELAVLREKQAREAEREREAKARRLAERRAKRRAAKRDFAAAEAEYVRRAREREREREAENEGHFEHESLAGPEGLSDHEAGHGHEGQAAHVGQGGHEGQAGHEVRADHEGRKSSRGEGTRAPGRSAVREGYNVTNDDEPAGHYRLAPGGRFVYRAVPRKKKQRGRWRLFIIGVFMMLVVPMVSLAGSLLYITGGPSFFKAGGQLLPESGQVALEAKTNYMLYPLTTRDVDSCSVSDPDDKAVVYKEGSSQFPAGSFTSTTAGTYVIKCQNTKDTKVVGPAVRTERLDALSVGADLGFGVAIAGVWVTVVGWRRARARGRK